MARKIEIFSEGLVCEFEDEQPVKVTKTEGRVDLLLKTLQFTLAETFTLASPDAVPPDVPVSRAPQRNINAEGLKLLTSFEGLHELKYGPDGEYIEAYQDPVGVWTIGWGCTEGVYPGMKINRAQAESLLRQELEKFEAAVTNCVKVQINDNQFSALVSFSYNVGAYALFKSTLLKYLNQGKYQEAADELLRWDKAKGKSFLGLARRRRAERSLFLSEPWEWARSWEWDRLLRLAQPNQPLMQGDDVVKLQKALVKAGFNIQVDGIFGKATDDAVRKFQKQQGLTVDGVVGALTRQALDM